MLYILLKRYSACVLMSHVRRQYKVYFIYSKYTIFYNIMYGTPRWAPATRSIVSTRIMACKYIFHTYHLQGITKRVLCMQFTVLKILKTVLRLYATRSAAVSAACPQHQVDTTKTTMAMAATS